MIGRLEGKVQYKEDRGIIISSGGVGYAVAVTTATALRTEVGTSVALWTHLSVRDDALELYGFKERSELVLFRRLIGISGIGPKSALNVLSLADTGTLIHAIRRGDGAYLTKVSGIGKRLAEKIILELKEKISGMEGVDESPRAEDEALDALETLGYPARDTREIVRSLTGKYEKTEDIIRKALQALGRTPSSPIKNSSH